MKSKFALWVLASGIIIACQPETTTEVTEEPAVPQTGIRWVGENEIASHMAVMGVRHYMQIELEKAYAFSQEAVRLDPTLFASHTLLAMMSRGETAEKHTQLAKQHVANENEAGKLFVSLLDVARDSLARQNRHEIWTKMHELSAGRFIHYMYARSWDWRNDFDGGIKELDNLIARAQENERTLVEAAANNIKGYQLYQGNDDLEGGTAAIERYLELYPEGYNSYDSRAEFYLFAGDTATAIEWYRKTVGQYRWATGALNHLRELNPQD